MIYDIEIVLDKIKSYVKRPKLRQKNIPPRKRVNGEARFWLFFSNPEPVPLMPHLPSSAPIGIAYGAGQQVARARSIRQAVALAPVCCGTGTKRPLKRGIAGGRLGYQN